MTQSCLITASCQLGAIPPLFPEEQLCNFASFSFKSYISKKNQIAFGSNLYYV